MDRQRLDEQTIKEQLRTLLNEDIIEWTKPKMAEVFNPLELMRGFLIKA